MDADGGQVRADDHGQGPRVDRTPATAGSSPRVPASSGRHPRVDPGIVFDHGFDAWIGYLEEVSGQDLDGAFHGRFRRIGRQSS